MPKLTNLLMVGGFCLLLVIPGVFGLVKPATAILPNMAQEPLPTKPWLRSFPRRFEAFFNTHLGLRRQLVTAQSALNFYAFGISASSAVLVGLDGFAFLNQDYMPESIAGGRFPSQDLSAWVSVFKQAQAQMDQWGGKVLVVVAPNKASIYPEKLPEHVREARGEPRLDAFLAQLHQQNIAAIDLRPVLTAEKRNGLIYPKRDTHWIGRGAAAAALAISAMIEELTHKPSLLTREHIHFREANYAGDLTRMLALEGWADERIQFPEVEPPRVSRRENLSKKMGAADLPFYFEPVAIYEAQTREGATALIHHDSFGRSLKAVLSHGFKKSTWVEWTQSLNHEVLVRDKPDVLIYLTAERYLHKAPPTPW